MMNQENNYKNKKGLALGPRRAVAYLAFVFVAVLCVFWFYIFCVLAVLFISFICLCNWSFFDRFPNQFDLNQTLGLVTVGLSLQPRSRHQTGSL